MFVIFKETAHMTIKNPNFFLNFSSQNGVKFFVLSFKKLFVSYRRAFITTKSRKTAYLFCRRRVTRVLGDVHLDSCGGESNEL